MFRKFFPDVYMESTYKIDFQKLYEKGYRGVIFDIDNTLVPHGEPADKRAVELFENLKKIGFQCCLLSNNQYERVNSFNEQVQVQFIENAHKPSRKNYQKAMDNILVKPIHPKEEIQIVFKRKLEKIVLYFYEKEQKKKER